MNTKEYQIKEDLSINYDEIEGWLIRGQNGIYKLGRQSQYSKFLLPILEGEFYDFYLALNELSFNQTAIDQFPIETIVAYPFENKMEYWSNLALNWIERGNLINKLSAWAITIDRSWMSQGLFHKFNTLFKIRSSQMN